MNSFNVYCARHTGYGMQIAADGKGCFCRVCDEAYYGKLPKRGTHFCKEGVLYDENPLEREEEDER